MPSPIIEILIILVLIIANGVFALMETALVSAKKARLQQRSDDGDQGAAAALVLIEQPNAFLSTLQIGITLIGILSGAVGGATLSEELAAWLAKFSGIQVYAQWISMAVVVIAITYLSLVLGELVPKRLALNNPEDISSNLSRFLKFLSRLFAPIVRLLSASTDFTLAVLGAHPSDSPPVTHEEIKVLIEQGREVGVFQDAERDMVSSVFRLGGRGVGAMIVPRTEIVWLDASDPIEDLVNQVLESQHTYFPVADDDLDNVIGILKGKDLLAGRMTNENMDIRTLLIPSLFVPETTPALTVLEEIKKSGTEMAMVIDEYGGLQGMVTLYDVLEAIIGEIHVLGEVSTPDAVQREDGSWLFDGMMPIDEFKEKLNIDSLPSEDRAGFQTVGGFIMTQIGNIPNPGEHFSWNGLRFEVVDMDGRRVDKILVSPEKPTDSKTAL